MRNKTCLLLLVIFLALPSYADSGLGGRGGLGTPPPRIEEADRSPSSIFTKIIFDDDTVTMNGSHAHVSVAAGAQIATGWTDDGTVVRLTTSTDKVSIGSNSNTGKELEVYGSVLINDGGLSTADVRIEGDTDANLFFLDASADKIGVGDSSPSHRSEER